MTILVLVVIAAVVALPWIMEMRRLTVDQDIQESAPGEMIETRLGKTHINWHGPARGPVVVAIHGLTTPSPVWNAVAMRLGELGYRTLTYDLYGRGFSDAPKGEQNCAFFLNQLQDVLDSQGLDDDLTLIGFSMGGSIATAYSAAHPDRMRRVILLASGGLDQNVSKFSKFCINTPVVGDWLFGLVGARRGKKGIQAEERMLDIEVEGLSDAQRAEYGRKGFLRSVLASRRGILADEMDAEHKLISRAGIPVVAIWGTKDTAIPLSSMGRLAQVNRVARQDQVDGATHAMPYTHSMPLKSILSEVLTERD